TAAHYGAEIEQRRIETLRERQVDGLLMLSPSDIHDHDHLRALHQSGMPLVTINRYCEEMGFWRIFFAFRSATYAVTRRLIAAGHRQIVLVGGTPEHPQMSVRERVAGYRQAMQEAGLWTEVAEVCGGMLPHDGEVLAGEVLRQWPQATALLAINDLLASGMLRALRRAGLRFPDDMAVVSLHDTMIGECTDPPLTAIEHSAREAGREGCRLLIEQIEEPDRPTGTLVLPASLVVRQSCGFGSVSAAEERIPLESLCPAS
ncbi:MAG TPA: substrate-binding domain-containing protein, partial [Chthonomonadaceae bacterium]|nr:substrate-binding domain-containing protein [Chthonomonadaceae bacterium]